MTIDIGHRQQISNAIREGEAKLVLELLREEGEFPFLSTEMVLDLYQACQENYRKKFNLRFDNKWQVLDKKMREYLDELNRPGWFQSVERQKSIKCILKLACLLEKLCETEDVFEQLAAIKIYKKKLLENMLSKYLLKPLLMVLYGVVGHVIGLPCLGLIKSFNKTKHALTQLYGCYPLSSPLKTIVIAASCLFLGAAFLLRHLPSQLCKARKELYHSTRYLYHYHLGVKRRKWTEDLFPIFKQSVLNRQLAMKCSPIFA